MICAPAHRNEQERLFRLAADAVEELAAETIVAAAVRIPVQPPFAGTMWMGKPVYPEFLTVTAPPPARHGTLMHPLSDYTESRIGPDDQGFLTSTGRFVGRKEAHAIAVAAGQPMIDHGSRIPGTLYSEDLW